MTIIFSIVAITLASVRAYAKPADKKPSAAEQLGREVLESFRNQSATDYARLFPTLEELHQLMRQNGDVYNVFLGVAMEDFAKTYYAKVLPELVANFDDLVVSGSEKGVDWASAKFVSATENVSGKPNGEGTIAINFDSNGKKYRLLIEKVIAIEDQLKVTQFISLQ